MNNGPLMNNGLQTLHVNKAWTLSELTYPTNHKYKSTVDFSLCECKDCQRQEAIDDRFSLLGGTDFSF